MSLTSQRAALALFVIALVALLGIIVLTALHDAIPAVLEQIALAALTGGAGVAVPAHAASSSKPAADPAANL